MISKSLIMLMHEAASIQRWNDHIRPWTGFTELDKQAHKMFYAYVLGKCEQGTDRLKLIEGGIFEFFHRIILTDIKPPVYYKLMKKKGAHLTKWVLEQLGPQLEPLKGGFYERMINYYTDDQYAKKEKEILRAAHYYATSWEFGIIYEHNKTTFDIEKVKKEIAQGLASCDTFAGYRYFASSPYLQEFLSLIGKLRYQQRWSKAARIPQTYVMGHMLVVAIMSFFCSLEACACDIRCINNFFGGLFHDLPEVLTRDIVSPVKASVEGLNDIINEIEEEQMEEVIYPLLPPEWIDELKYFTINEFCSKIVDGNEILVLTSDEINESFNEDRFCGIDGEIIRGCDHLSAFLEAYLSLSYGVGCEQIITGYEHLSEKYKLKKIGGIDFSKLFGYFEL